MIGRISDIDLRLLRAFVTIVESGGFSLGAVRMNVSESTISSQMSDLETRLGLRLCERGRGGFRLTRVGEEVYKYTTDMLSGMDSYRDHLAALTSTISSRFKLGLPDASLSNAALPLTDWVTSLMDEMPEVHLDIQFQDPRNLERKIIDQDLLAAIGPEHRDVAGLEYVPLSMETNLLYCSRQHPIFDMPDSKIAVDDLREAGLISRGYIERFDSEFFGTTPHAATVHHIEAATLLILTGRMLGFLPDHHAAPFVATGTMRSVKPDTIRLDVRFSLFYKRSRADDPRIKKFKEIVSRPSAPGFG